MDLENNKVLDIIDVAEELKTTEAMVCKLVQTKQLHPPIEKVIREEGKRTRRQALWKVEWVREAKGVTLTESERHALALHAMSLCYAK